MCARSRPRRRGFSLLECIVAAGMLCAIFVLFGQLIVWDSRERSADWKRQVAAQEAANVLERLSLEPYASLTADRLTQLQLSPAASEWLTDGALRVTATDVAAPRPGKRIDVAVDWAGATHRDIPPLRLVGWRFAPGGAP